MKKFVRVLIPINDEYLILLEKRNRLKWNFPGGKVEENESFINACIREVYEETNLEIKELTFIKNLNIGGWEGYYYYAKEYTGEIRMKESKTTGYKTISESEFYKYNTYISEINPRVKVGLCYE